MDMKQEWLWRNGNSMAKLKWENLYDRCPLYWDFAEGKIESTQDIYFLARGMCGAEKGKNKFLERSCTLRKMPNSIT